MARILTTGGTRDIGLAAASQLAKNPNEPILHWPEPAFAQVAHGPHPDNKVSYVSANFADPDQMRPLAGPLLSGSGTLDFLVDIAASAVDVALLHERLHHLDEPFSQWRELVLGVRGCRQHDGSGEQNTPGKLIKVGQPFDQGQDLTAAPSTTEVLR